MSGTGKFKEIGDLTDLESIERLICSGVDSKDHTSLTVARRKH